MKKLEIDRALAALLNKALELDAFFPEFKKEHLEAILVDSALYLYPKNSRVVEQGQEGRDLYVIQKGRAAVLKKEGGSSRCVAILKDGDIFGEIGLLRAGVRTATVVTQEVSAIFRFAYSDILALLRRSPELGAHLDAIAKRRMKPLSPP